MSSVESVARRALGATVGAIAARLVQDIDDASVVNLPTLAGLPAADLVRAMLAMLPDRWPQVVLIERLRDADAPEVWWVCEPRQLSAAHTALSEGKVTKVLVSGGQELPASERGVARAGLLARMYPGIGRTSLTQARQKVLDLCEGGELFSVHGPDAELVVRWAHVMLATTPLCWVRTAREAASALRDRWLVLGWDERGEGLERWLESRMREASSDAVAFGPATHHGAIRPTHAAFAPILGSSPALAQVLGRAERAATLPVPVLIVGETGTGKEGLARAIHDASGRSGAFLALDTSARAADLIVADLFGHEKGAFSGAVRDRPGAFREAHGGTLFLDEVENLAPQAQQALLRVLESGAIQPIGSDRLVQVDVRIVAATNEDPRRLVDEGRLRADLMYRLMGLRLDLPPLRQRPGDIELLARHFAAQECRTGQPLRLSPAALSALKAWPWPGNVRELRNVIRAAAIDADLIILPEHLGAPGEAAGPRPPVVLLSAQGRPPQALPAVEADASLDAPPDAPRAEGPTRRLWRLSSQEAEAVAEMLARYSERGGSFTAAVESFAEEIASALPTLSAYLRSTRPGQSIVRLLEHADNDRARAAVLSALGSAPGDRGERLPSRLRVALGLGPADGSGLKV